MSIKHLGNNGMLYMLQKVKTALAGKVDKVDGKGLFSGKYTDLTGRPTKVSEFSNDAGYQSAAQVDTAITGKGYKTGEEVESAIAAKGYQTAAQVNTTVTGKGYQTAAQVESAITGKGYQTAAQVQTAVNAAGHLKRQKVTTKPTDADAKENIIYLVPKSGGSGDNVYDEYLLLEGKLERIGDSQVDLTGYVQESDITETSNAEIDTIWNTVFGG